MAVRLYLCYASRKNKGCGRTFGEVGSWMASSSSVPPLSHKPWFSGIYEKIYEIIAMENRLPPPNEIMVSDKPLATFSDTVAGSADIDNRLLWFREEPPHPFVFAHELIHIADKKISREKRLRLEEVYASNLADLVVLLADLNIPPPTNPLRLFEDVGLKDVADAMRRYLKLQGSDREVIEQYCELTGIIPPIAEKIAVENDDVISYRVKIKDNIPDEAITHTIISMLIAAAATLPAFKEQEIILDLLNRLAIEENEEEDDLIEGWDEEKKIWEEIEEEG
jgi:hypothetical protein